MPCVHVCVFLWNNFQTKNIISGQITTKWPSLILFNILRGQFVDLESNFLN